MSETTATFIAHVRCSTSDFDAVDQAAAQVEAYLYSPFKIVSTRWSDRLLHSTIVGVYEHQSQAEGERLVTYQRDRFASGLIPTSDPTFMSLTDQQREILSTAKHLQQVLDANVPSSTVHYAVESARQALTLLAAAADRIKTNDVEAR